MVGDVVDLLREGLTNLPVATLEESADNQAARHITDERFALLCQAVAHDPAMLEPRPLIAELPEPGPVAKLEVIAGNMRLRAIKHVLEHWNESSHRLRTYIEERGGVPVYLKRFADDAERREWMVRDNAGYGEWVPEGLAALVAAQGIDGRSVELLGMSNDEAAGLVALLQEPEPKGGHGDPERTPPAPEEPDTRPGDVWQLGDHVIVCGDAAHPDSYARLIEHGFAGGWDAIWTDPPYGVAYDPDERASYFSQERLAKPMGGIEGDEKVSVDAYRDWLAAVLEHAGASLREGGAVYLCHADKMVEAVAAAWRLANFYFANQLIWRKGSLIRGWGDYHYQHEPIYYGWKTGANHRFFGDRTDSTVFDVGDTRPHGESYVHPNQKPFELIKKHLENSTEPGDVVLDMFGGSGSTLLTCDELGRRCAMLELDPRFVDVERQRWADYCDGEPQLLYRVDS